MSPTEPTTGRDHGSARAAPKRWVNAAVIGQETARATWALAAYERLAEAARTYGAVLTYKELAEHVQERSLIRTGQAHVHWIGDVLRRVSEECVSRRVPLLSSLCVDARGHVGPGYAIVLEGRGQGPVDPDAHAAQERLECHRSFGAELPPGGGEPISTVVLSAPRPARTARASGSRTAGPAPAAQQARRVVAARPTPMPDTPLAVCPVHFTVLPGTGVCDDCA